MFEIEICHRVAQRLSYHHAAEGGAWFREADARAVCSEQWRQCRAWLYDQGLLEDFMKSSDYLIGSIPMTMDLAERDAAFRRAS